MMLGALAASLAGYGGIANILQLNRLTMQNGQADDGESGRPRRDGVTWSRPATTRASRRACGSGREEARQPSDELLLVEPRLGLRAPLVPEGADQERLLRLDHSSLKKNGEHYQRIAALVKDAARQEEEDKSDRLSGRANSAAGRRGVNGGRES